eukprot:tig00020848_g14576.t1
MADLLTGAAPASADGFGPGEREQSRVLRAVFEGRMLDRLVRPQAPPPAVSTDWGWGLRPRGYPDPHDLVHPRPRRRAGRVAPPVDEARRGWLPPEMDAAAAYMLDWLLTLYDDLCDGLREMSSPCAPFVEPVLHNLLRLYFGQEHLFEAATSDAKAGDPLAAYAPGLAPPPRPAPGAAPPPAKPSLVFAAEPVDRWSIGLHHAVAPIVEELITAAGGGGPPYAAVRDFLRPAAAGSPSARVYVPTAPPGIAVRVPRAGSFWREVAEAGESMARAFRFGQPRTRLSGLDHLRAVATVAGGSGPGGAPHPYGYDEELEGRAEVCVALRLVERLAPLLDDPDAEIRAAVLRIFVEVAKAAGSRLVTALCTGPAVAAVVRRFRAQDEQPRAQRLALEILALLARGDEPAVEALRSADAFAVLARSTAPGRVDGRWSASAAAAATRGKDGSDLCSAVKAALKGLVEAGSPACLEALERSQRLRALLEAAGVDLRGARSLPDIAASLEGLAAAIARRDRALPRGEPLQRAAGLLGRLEALVVRRAYVRAATGADLASDPAPSPPSAPPPPSASSPPPSPPPSPPSPTRSPPPSLPPLRRRRPAPVPPLPSPSAPLPEPEPALASLLVACGAVAAAARCLDDPFWEAGPEPAGQDRGIAPRPAAGAVPPSRALALANHPLLPARAAGGPSATPAAAGQAAPAAELLGALAEAEFGRRLADHVHQQVELLRSLARVGGLEAHQQLLAAGFVEAVLLDYLPDTTFVDVGHRLVPRSFIPFDRTFLIREEATRLAAALAAARPTAPDVFHALLVSLRKHGVVASEVDVLREAERRPLQATAPAFLAALLPASHYDPAMHGLLVEAGVGLDVERAHAAALEARLRAAPREDPAEDPLVAACQAFFAPGGGDEAGVASALISDHLRAGLIEAEKAGVAPAPGPAATDPGESDAVAAEGPPRTLHDPERRAPASRPQRKPQEPVRRPQAAPPRERWAEAAPPPDEPDMRDEAARGQIRTLLRASAAAGRAPIAQPAARAPSRGRGGARDRYAEVDAEEYEAQLENRFYDPNQAPHYPARFQPDPRSAHPRKATPKRRYVVS